MDKQDHKIRPNCDPKVGYVTVNAIDGVHVVPVHVLKAFTEGATLPEDMDPVIRRIVEEWLDWIRG